MQAKMAIYEGFLRKGALPCEISAYWEF